MIGVARDGKYNTLSEDPTPFYFLPILQNPAPANNGITIVARTTGDPLDMAPAVKHIIHDIDRNLPVFGVETLIDRMGPAYLPVQLAGAVLGIFGFLALVLATVGLYGVMAYLVSQRTHEIGVRMALGAQPGDVRVMIMRKGMVLTLIGIALGLVGAFFATRFIVSLLYGISTADPVTFIGIALLLTCVSLAASYIPARRATLVDPMVALRNE